MRHKELIDRYLNYFKSQNHSIISGKSLIPDNDPTVLFTTAGMHPLVPYLLGQAHPQGNRLTNVQGCIRTGDIDEVGDNTHLTYFQMLGNWSLGDYYKKESITFSYNFLVNELKFNPKKLAVTVFGGQDNIPKDEVSEGVWKDLGITNITYLGKEDNFWGPAGKTGPCGPDTEIFYYLGNDENPKTDPKTDKQWVEIWNNVFMEFVKDENGNYTESQRKCVDTGMGVERMLCILNNKDNVYDTEVFVPIIEKISQLTSKEYKDNKKNMRVIADHIKASCLIIGDVMAIAPSNLGAGYVLRRLIRKAIRVLRILFDKNYKSGTLSLIADSVFAIYPEYFNEKNIKNVKNELEKEETKFLQTLDKGEAEFIKMLEIFKAEGKISGQNAFRLYETYGFPLELTQDIAKEHGLEVDVESYNVSLENHKNLSKIDVGVFKGGLQDSSYETTKLHTAAHLLNRTLKNMFGEDVGQKGSNITAERLRFDFNFERKLTDQEIKQITDTVNEQIDKGLEITYSQMPLDKAKQMGAIAAFDSKYEEIVKVYKIGDYSLEVCGGPHVENTKELGKFEIQKEQSSSSGVRRIKAVLK